MAAMTFRFLHLADLHLASGVGGRPATKARLRAGLVESFGDAMDLALKERLDAVLIAGDAYDEEKLTPRVMSRMLEELERVAREGLHVCWVTGNHDPGAAGQRASDWIAKDLARAGDWAARVHLFTGPEPRAVEIGDVGLVVGAGHPRDREQRNLAATFPRPDALDCGKRAVVGLLHTQVEGASSDHALYAPSTAADFAARPYSYWALGHVHKRGNPVPGQPVHYAGNLMGRSAKPSECGAKGGLLVSAEPGVAATPEFVALGRYRWERLVVDTHKREDAGLAAVRDAEHREGLVRALGAWLREALPDALDAGRTVLRVEWSGPARCWEFLRDAEYVTDLAVELERALGLLELDLRAEGVFAELDRTELAASPTVLARALELHAELASAPSLDAALGALCGGGLELAELPSDAAEREAYLRELWRDLDALAIERLLAGRGA